MTYSELYRSWIYFKKGKKKSLSIDYFQYRLFMSLSSLVVEVNRRSYRHRGYQRVIIEEKKRRDLAVATVRDRVIHRFVYDQLVQIYDKTFDFDVWSSRKEKGLHNALERTKKLLETCLNAHVWRADITKFFDTVDHATLYTCLARKIDKSSELYWLCQQIISSYTTISQPAFVHSLEREKSSPSVRFILRPER